MFKSLAVKDVKLRLICLGFDLVGNYNGARYKSDILCLKHNKIFGVLCCNVFKGQKLLCCKSQVLKTSKTFTIKEAKEKSLTFGFELLDDVWHGAKKQKYRFRCFKHNEIHECGWEKILLHSSIRCCYLEKQRLIKRPTGKEHYNYNPNLTKKERDGKRIHNYSWRVAIKKKFNNTCQICFKSNLSGNNCIAHHLNSYMAFPDIQSDVNNGVCLCENCHISFHKMYGFGKNTDSQYKEFTKIKQGAKR